MTKEKNKLSWIKCADFVTPFLGPIVFEISNTITGDWINDNGGVNLSIGKIITILIGIVYVAIMIWLLKHNNQEKNSIDELQQEVSDSAKKIKTYEKSNETVCTLLAYLRDKIKEQIDYLKESNKIDVRNLNINSAAANICKIIYQNIIENSDKSVKITVNMYDKISENGIQYSIMIAHEGHISQPDAFGVKKILKKEKNVVRYCDKILLSDRPDYRILLDRRSVAKAFGQTINKCKYNQYLGIPIRKKGGQNIALIEIVAHGETVVWENVDTAKQFAANYCEILKEYVLLMDRIYEQGEAIAHKMDEGGI